MKVIIYVQPSDVEAMDKWLKGESIKLTPPAFWFEPLKSVNNRPSIIQIVITTDDFQRLLDASIKEPNRPAELTDEQLKLKL